MAIHEKSLIAPEDLMTADKLVIDGVDVSGHWNTMIRPRYVSDYDPDFYKTIQGYGGGLKFRTGKRFGLIAEYRHHRIKKKSASYGMGGPTTYVIRETYYIGGGIAYLF